MGVLYRAVLALRLATFVLSTVVVYSALAFYAENVAQVSQALGEGAASLRLSNKGLIPVSVTLRLELWHGDYSLIVERAYEVVPGASVPAFFDVEHVLEELPEDVLAKLAFERSEITLRITAKIDFSGLLSVTLRGSRKIPVGPLVEHCSVSVVSRRALNLTHAAVRVRAECYAPGIPVREATLKVFTGTGPAERIPLLFDESGHAAAEREIIVALESKALEAELCVHSVCRPIAPTALKPGS